MILIVSTPIIASPKVGDMGLYRINIPGAGEFYSRVELVGYDVDQDSFIQHNIGYTTEGVFSDKKIIVPAKKINNREYYQQQVDLCESRSIKGRYGIYTIANFNIKVCEVEVKGNLEVFGDVPFGLVAQSGSTILVELIDFMFGGEN